MLLLLILTLILDTSSNASSKTRLIKHYHGTITRTGITSKKILL